MGFVRNNFLKVKPLCFNRYNFCKLCLRNCSSNFNKTVKSSSSSSEVEISGESSEKRPGWPVGLPPILRNNYGLSKVEEKDKEVVEDLKQGNPYYPFSGPYERAFFRDKPILFKRNFAHNLTESDIEKSDILNIPRYADVLIIGGGVLGLAIAYNIKSFASNMRVFVIDKKDVFPPVSTNLRKSVIIPQEFHDELEIEMNKYGAQFFRTFLRNTFGFQANEILPFKLTYEPTGLLTLIDQENEEEALKQHEILKSHEISNVILDKETLRTKFPWLNTEDVVFGSLGMRNQGIIDPWSYLFGLKRFCLEKEVNFITGEVMDFNTDCDGPPCRAIYKLPNGTYNYLEFPICVLACGMESLNLVEKINSNKTFNLKLNLPLEEILSYEYCFHNPDGPGLNTPIVKDFDGVHFRREGLLGHYVANVSSMRITNDNDDIDPYKILENKIKPFLTKRVPDFEKYELVSGWADVQEFCFSNEVGILGPHPETDAIIFALGFSHRGLQQIPAVSRAVTELIFYKEFKTIDFTPYSIDNLWKKQHLEFERKRRELLEAKLRVSISDK